MDTKPLPTIANMVARYKPGDIVMHTNQYNQLCELMRVQRQGDKSQTVWNSIPVHINNNMPAAGWFIMPGEPQ